MRYFVTRAEDTRLDDALRANVRGDFIETEPGVTHFELTGPSAGEVVLLVGGLTVPLYYWDEFAATLHARGYRTLTYSTFGRGYSDRVRATYDEKLFVDQAHTLCDGLGLTPRHVVGASMGALIAMACLRERPGAASTLSLVGPAGLDSARPLPLRLLSLGPVGAALAKRFGRNVLDTHTERNVRDPQLSATLRTMVAECYRVEGSIYSLCSTLVDFDLFGRQDLYRQTSTSGIPTLLVWGADDEVTPISHLEQVSTLLTPRQTHVLDGCGHMAPLEKPLLVAQQVSEFIATSASSS